jgi:hypothetical protein
MLCEFVLRLWSVHCLTLYIFTCDYLRGDAMMRNVFVSNQCLEEEEVIER